MLTGKQSRMLYVAKGLAVVLIVWAHMSLGDRHPMMESIRISITQIGVGVFFLCTGFFYHRETGDSRAFYRKKVRSIFVPWILLATFTFFISFIMNRLYRQGAAFVLVAYVKWILGIGTHYWYLSVMAICFVLFKGLLSLRISDRAQNMVLYSCIVVSACSVVLSVFECYPYNLSFNQYTNVLNWVGWFALGYLIRKKQWLDLLSSLPVLLLSFPILSVLVTLSAGRSVAFEAYIDIFSLPIQLFGAVCVFGVAGLLNKVGIFQDIGRKSFFIYLIHIQIAGAINTRLPDTGPFLILRPIIAVAVCYIVAKCGEWILKKVKLYDRIGVYLALR